MTKSKKISDYVSTWTSRLTQGIEYREKYSSFRDWPKYRDYYRGNWPANVKRPSNVIFNAIKALVPRTYFRTPSVVVTPNRLEYTASAHIIEAIDQYLIREVNLKQAMKRIIPDASICGAGFLKLGFDSEFGFVSSTSIGSNMQTATSFSTKDGTLIEYNLNIKPGMPWAIRVRPDDIITPYGYDTIESMPWICHMIVRPLEDVQADQKYRNTKDLKGGYVPDSQHPLLKARRKAMTDFKDQEYCLLYEIRDAKTKKLVVICEDELILDVEDELQIEGLPYEVLIFNEDPDYFWGVSDVKVVLPYVEELCEVGLQASKQRKLSILKFLYQKGVLKKEDLDKLLSDDPEDSGVGIEVGGESLQAAVLPLQPHNLLQDIAADRADIESQVRGSLGFSRNQEGEYNPRSPKSATEATIVNKASETRIDERRDMVADLLERVLRKWNQYIFKFWDSKRVMQVAGADGAMQWVQFTGPEIKGEYGIRVDAESGLPVSKGMRYQMAKELYGTLRQDPYIQQMGLRQVLLRQFEWIDPQVTQLVTNPQQQMDQGAHIFPPDGGAGKQSGAGGPRLPGVQPQGPPAGQQGGGGL